MVAAGDGDPVSYGVEVDPAFDHVARLGVGGHVDRSMDGAATAIGAIVNGVAESADEVKPSIGWGPT